MKLKAVTWCASVALMGMATAFAVAGPKTNPAAEQPATKPSTQPIVNKTCPITKEPVDPDGKTYVYKNKKIGFCCASCIADFKKDPEKYMKDLK